MKEYSKFYIGLSWTIKLIVAIIPITAWVNSVLYRIGKGHLVEGLVCIPLGGIAWLVDLVSVILYGKPVVFAK